jgi:hypothetical protein
MSKLGALEDRVEELEQQVVEMADLCVKLFQAHEQEIQELKADTYQVTQTLEGRTPDPQPESWEIEKEIDAGLANDGYWNKGGMGADLDDPDYEDEPPF